MDASRSFIVSGRTGPWRLDGYRYRLRLRRLGRRQRSSCTPRCRPPEGVQARTSRRRLRGYHRRTGRVVVWSQSSPVSRSRDCGVAWLRQADRFQVRLCWCGPRNDRKSGSSRTTERAALRGALSRNPHPMNIQVQRFLTPLAAAGFRQRALFAERRAEGGGIPAPCATLSPCCSCSPAVARPPKTPMPGRPSTPTHL